MVDVPRTAERGRQDISMSGLTEPEAREFHRVFITSFIVFVVVALVAHFLVWQWRPWLPGEGGYSAVAEGARLALGTITARFA